MLLMIKYSYNWNDIKYDKINGVDYVHSVRVEFNAGYIKTIKQNMKRHLYIICKIWTILLMVYIG